MIRILIVDDEPDIGTAIQKALEQRGFQADMYTEPEKALANFQPNVYDLVLLDIRMPKMNGFQLYRKLIKIDDKIRICFITAYEEYHQEFKKAFPELEEDRFIRKPIGITQLLGRIEAELQVPR